LFAHKIGVIYGTGYSWLSQGSHDDGNERTGPLEGSSRFPRALQSQKFGEIPAFTFCDLFNEVLCARCLVKVRNYFRMRQLIVALRSWSIGTQSGAILFARIKSTLLQRFLKRKKEEKMMNVSTTIKVAISLLVAAALVVATHLNSSSDVSDESIIPLCRHIHVFIADC
jgi:hypothetical protein